MNVLQINTIGMQETSKNCSVSKRNNTALQGGKDKHDCNKIAATYDLIDERLSVIMFQFETTFASFFYSDGALFAKSSLSVIQNANLCVTSSCTSSASKIYKISYAHFLQETFLEEE